MTFFSDVMMMASLKWRHNWFFKFDFFIISLKIHKLAKSRNFKYQYWRLNGAGVGALGNFLKFVTKTMHFRHVSANIQPKNVKRRFDWGERALWAHPLATPFPDTEHRGSYEKEFNFCNSNFTLPISIFSGTWRILKLLKTFRNSSMLVFYQCDDAVTPLIWFWLWKLIAIPV